MRVLSRLPERSMCGFSKLVAREVPQPLWPSRVPRIPTCSPMLGRRRLRYEDELGWLSLQVLVRLVSYSSGAESDCSQAKKVPSSFVGRSLSERFNSMPLSIRTPYSSHVG